MDYTMADLVERSGLAPRTIRSYIKQGIAAPPVGNGPAAMYGDEHLLRLVAATRLRDEGYPVPAVAEKLRGMSLAQVRGYVRRTEPKKEPAPAPPPQAPSPVDPPAIEGEPVPSGRQLPPVGAETRATMTAPPWPDSGSLPPTAHWGIFPLLPGMALMVREDAAPIVKSAAAEILARFGTQG